MRCSPPSPATLLPSILAAALLGGLMACAEAEPTQARVPPELSDQDIAELREAARAQLGEGWEQAEVELVYLDEEGKEYRRDNYPKEVRILVRVTMEAEGKDRREPIVVLLDRHTRELVEAAGSRQEPQASELPEPPATRYTVGDYVVYAYSGAALDAPVQLREEVLGVAGLQLTIRVDASRGEKHRAWRQVVTDTAENRANNVVDELYEIVGDEERPLDISTPAELYRLYSWVVPPMEGEPSDTSRSTRDLSVGGTSMQATCSSGRTSAAGGPADFTFCDAEAFLWTHAWAEITRPDGGELLFRMEVVEAGRR